MSSHHYPSALWRKMCFYLFLFSLSFTACNKAQIQSELLSADETLSTAELKTGAILSTQSGDVIFDEHGWAEYRVGDIPLVISVPHGGNLQTNLIADRTCPGSTTVTDANTIALARDIEAEFISKYGVRPYMIISHLSRKEVDHNREKEEGTCQDPMGMVAWEWYHDRIDEALQAAVNQHGRAVLIDLHGHGHTNLRLELGYNLTTTNLTNIYNNINLSTLQNKSSISNLFVLRPDLNFKDMIMDVPAFGTLMENDGVHSVPSLQDPHPQSGESFFSGGYITSHYTSTTAYPNVYGWQIECHRVGLRDTDANRKAFAKVFSENMMYYIDYTQDPQSADVLNTKQIKIGGWSSLGPEGDTYHVDLAAIERHNPASADNNQASIDMLNLWSGSGFVNFMTPSNGAVTAWGSSSRIVNWNDRNSGTFVRIESPNTAEQNKFNNLVSRRLLIEAYEDAVATVPNRPGYTLANHGPSTRIRHLAPGDIVYFKSSAPGRNLYAAIKVINITPGSANGREVVEILVKSNLK